MVGGSKSIQGYSLVELLVAVSLMAIITAAGAIGLQMAQKNSAKLASSVDETIESSFLGSYFVKIAEDADVSMLFLHQPVPTDACEAGKPCIQIYNTKTGLFNSYDKLSGKEPIEFFRDHIANIEKIPIKNGKSTGTVLHYTKPMESTDLPDENVHLTWPLIDSTSDPFFLLTRKKGNLSMKFAFESGQSEPLGTFSLFSIIGSVPSEAEFKLLENSLIVLFDAYDPRQYGIQNIKTIISCKYNMAACKKRLTDQNLTKIVPTDGHIMLELENLTDSLLLTWMPSVAGNLFPGPVTTNRFATHLNIVNESLPSMKAATPFDVRKWSHFADTQRYTSNIVVTPIRLLKYFIREKDSQKSLIRAEMNGVGQIQEVVDIDKVNDSVVFSRQIGRATLNLFVY